VRRRFIADGMLGKLAKWLRIAGYDAVYCRGAADGELAARALAEKRTLLTRDSRLVERKELRDFILVKSDDPFVQLKEVAAAAGLVVKKADLFSLCLECNEKVKRVKKADVRDEVPPYVYETQSYFRRCPSCKKLFWAGTHIENTLKLLRDLSIPIVEK